MIIHDVEQNSDEWYALRAGIPTSSEFSNLITAKTLKPAAALETYAGVLAGEKFAGTRVDPWLGNLNTDRGHDMEDDARRYYAFVTGADVQKVGFVTDDDHTVGCSPDGLVGADGGLEIKCLLLSKHVESLKFVDARECPPDFRLQVQGQLYVTGRKWFDLMFYHPILPKVWLRVKPDPEIQELLKTQLKTVLDKRDAIHEMLRRRN